MNPRRINDLLKLVGAVGAVIAAIAPFVPPQYAGTLAAVAGFFAGVGTRGFGLEYKDVAEAKADAKVLASILPPPPSATVMPPPVDVTPTAP